MNERAGDTHPGREGAGAHHGEKHDLILRAAAECFSQKGFDATSLDEIARRVKLHKATLYHYVDSKQDILYQCLTRSFRDYDGALDYLRDDSVSVLDRLRYFFRALAEAQNSIYGRCLTGVGIQGLGHEPGSRIRAFRRRLDYAMRALLEDGIEQGEIRPCRVSVVSAMIFGAFNWIGTWLDPQKGLTLDRVVDDFLDIVVNGLATRPQDWLPEGANLAATAGLSMPAAMAPPQREPGQDKRSEILFAAADFFSEKGYEGTSLNDIAQRVKLHKATLYHYVSGKSDLLYQCLAGSFGNLEEVAANVQRSDVAAVERFCYFFRNLIAAQNSDFGRCLNLINPEVLPAKEAQRFREFKARLDRIARDLLAEATAQGDLREISPVTASAFMFGASNWVPHWRRPDRDPDLKIVSDSFLRIYFAGISRA